jgi:hypothetical protein
MTKHRKFGKISPKVTFLLSLTLVFGNVSGGGIPAANYAASYQFLNQLNQAVSVVQPLSRTGYGMAFLNAARNDSSLLAIAFRQILDDPEQMHKLGLVTQDFRATWYLANPYDLLPTGLQNAIRQRKTPLKSRRQSFDWLNAINAPRAWKKALRKAFVETTADNLWRASRGKAPYAHNGEILKPVAIQSPTGELILQQGDIATDPRVIPPNSDVLLIIQAGDHREFVLARAADRGSGVRGHHIDIPIRLEPRLNAVLPHLSFPKQFHHPRVTVVLLGKLPRA